MGFTKNPQARVKNFSVLAAGLGITGEPRNSKIILIILLSNRMTSGIHAQNDISFFAGSGKPSKSG